MRHMTREYPTKSAAQQIIEARTGESIEVTLRRLYDDDGLTQDLIAIELDCSRDSVGRWMRTYGIRSRYLGRGRRKPVAA